MIAKSEEYRARALECEQCAKQATDKAIRRQWEDLAIQWHAMANQAAWLRKEPDAGRGLRGT
jgi:hypothetical protein